MAREKADRGDTMSSRSSKRGIGKSNRDEDETRSSKYGGHIGGGIGVEAMEPEILL
jgi:hypothetical protein